MVPVAAITVADNVRSEVGDLSDLIASVKDVGVLEPVLVTRNGDGFVLVIGQRRLAAAKAAGLKAIPAVVRDLEDVRRAELQLIENLHRLDLSPVEEGRAFHRLVEEFGYSQRQVATKVGRSQGHITKRLALLDLPEDVQAKVGTDALPVASALALAPIAADPEAVTAVVKEASRYSGGLGRRENVERVVGEALRQRQYEAKLAKAKEAAVADPAPVVEMVADRFGRAALPGSAVLLGSDWGRLNLSPTKHRKAPCHAVTVVDAGPYGRDPTIAYVCTDPKNHPAQLKLSEGLHRAPGPMTDDEKADRAAKREHKAALAEAQEKRRAFVRDRLRRRVVPDEAVALLLQIALVSEPWDRGPSAPLAGDLLGLGSGEDEELGVDDEDLLKIARGKQKADVTRLALAYAISGPEAALVRGEWNPAAVGLYFAWLRKQGYRPGAAERLELKAGDR
jgi:ParB/RepB/Spo0J family partition protein